MMKIVFLHHANVCRGGIERMLALKANFLVEEDCDVTMLTYEQNSIDFPYPLSTKVKCTDLNVHLYAAYKYSYPKRYFVNKDLRNQLAMAIRNYLRNNKTDIVVCTDKDPIELQILASVHTTEKIVVEGHTSMVDKKMQIKRANSIISKLQAWRTCINLKQAIARFDLYIALTPEDSQLWQQQVKTAVIPNFLSTYPEETVNLKIEHKRVISVGRLNYQKGQDMLLKAWKSIEDKHPDWHLDIFGDGNDKVMLEDLIKKMNLMNVIIHPSTTDIYAEYKTSDFLVCSSRWEAFGLIIMEAMACGIPAISFDCDNGPRNIITEGEDGLLAKKENVTDLAIKMSTLIENHNLRIRMGEKAHENMKKYNAEKASKQYLNFLETLCTQ